MGGQCMVDISLEIFRLVQYGIDHGLLEPEDRVYASNRILNVLGLQEIRPEQPEEEHLSGPEPILTRILDWAAENGRLRENTLTYRDLLDSELMNCLMPRPSEVIRTFWGYFAQSPQAATDYYYRFSQNSHYIRTDRVAKDERWTVPTKYGKMIITINLSKPEKDPKAIAMARTLPASGYPKCALCRETEGFAGTVSQAPRGNHRIIPLTLTGEPWFLQYSPYVYYNEHCIVLNEKHTPMAISRKTFQRLLDFVTRFPHYFLGSNADLPIVGGSILSHDHFQGGRADFPMASAPIYQEFSFRGFRNIKAG